MRDLNRLNQFQRLWQQSQGAPQQTCVAEMARFCYCSERHVRTLLNHWQSAGWLRWQGEPGRGKKGELEFLCSPEALRQTMLQQRLAGGNAIEALELLEVAPERLMTLLRPMMGGQWQNNAPVLRIPWHRPLGNLHPLLLTGRAEQHLARQLFSGLTRFKADEPVGDLAHHWQHDEAACTWLFWLRPQLYWHNDEPIEASQLVTQFQRLLQNESAAKLLREVISIDVPHPLAIRFQLHQSDHWLPHRLAHLFSLLPHPEQQQVGSGPWKLVHFTEDLVRIESHSRGHLALPLMQAVEYWIAPQIFDPHSGSSCRHPVQIAIGNAAEMASLRQVSRSISLGFCYLVCRPRAGFTHEQSRCLIQLIQQSGLIAELPLEEGLITPSEELLPGWPVPQTNDEPIALPAYLTLHYHLPVELHVMADALRTLLQSKGCQLTVVFHDVKHWRECDNIDEADLVMGDRLIGDAPVFTLASWLQIDPLWQPLMQTPLGDEVRDKLVMIQSLASEHARSAETHQLFHQLMCVGILTPLFNYRYQIFAPHDVEGVELNAMGWFDFAQAWIAPPLLA